MKVSGQFLVVNERQNRKIKISEIIHCTADINYTTIDLGYKKIVCARTIKILGVLLSGFGFRKSHRKHLINQAFIKKINCPEMQVELSTGLILPISRRQLKDFIRYNYKSPKIL